MIRAFHKAEVSPASPAALLAKSLTDPETRGEWERSHKHSYGCLVITYENASRDISVRRVLHFSIYSGGARIATPFTLTAREKTMVRDAMRAFDRHLADQLEQAALARLVAPKKAKGK